MRYIKLWEGITSDWRYSKSPTHFRVYIQCLVEAWHADAREFKRGTFRTSKAILADKTGYSVKTIERVLNDLSNGDQPEIVINTNRGYSVGYTEVLILNYDKYQSNTSPVPSNTSPVPSNTSPVPSNTSPVPSNTSPVPSNTSPVRTKEEEEKKVKEDKKEEGVVSSFSFEELIELYPKSNSHKAETISLFNNLSLDEKKKCISFAKHLQQIWKQNGIQDKYQFIKSCHTFVELKMFNGKPEDIFPREISTEVKVVKFVHEDEEAIKKIKEYQSKLENKRKQYEEANQYQ